MTVEEDFLKIIATIAVRTCRRETIRAGMDQVIAMVGRHRAEEEAGLVEIQTRTFRHHAEKAIAGILTTVQREEVTADNLAGTEHDHHRLRLNATTIEAQGTLGTAHLHLRNRVVAGTLVRGLAVGAVTGALAVVHTPRPIILHPHHRGLPAGLLMILGLAVALVLAPGLVTPGLPDAATVVDLQNRHRPVLADPDLDRLRNLGQGRGQGPGPDPLAGVAVMIAVILLVHENGRMLMEKISMIEIVVH